MKRTLLLLLLCAAAALVGAAAFTHGAQASTAGGPDKAVLESISSIYGPVNFDHSTHTMMSQGCADCHHSHQQPKNLDCNSCHALSAEQFKKSLSSSFMACRNCHADASAESPGMPSLKVAYHRTCFQCHKGMGNVGKGPEGCTEQCHAKK